MSAAYSIFTTYSTITCCECGVPFGVPDSLKTILLRDKRAFYCPNGHAQGFYGDNEVDKLKKELEQEKKRRLWAEEAKAAAYKGEQKAVRRAVAYRGVITKNKKRVGNGICPCCNRTFQNLMNHMKSKHPKYKDEKK